MVSGLVCFLMKQDLAGNSLIELRFHVLSDAISVLNKFLDSVYTSPKSSLRSADEKKTKNSTVEEQ